MNRKILYIGNNLTKKTKYNSTMAVLSKLLESEGYSIILSSDKTNKVLRLLDMCFTTFLKRNSVDYILIDTFSTINFYYALIVSQIARIFKVKYIPILHGGSLPERIAKNIFLSKLIFNYSYKNIAPSFYLKNEFEKKGFETQFIPNILEIDDYKFKTRKTIKPRLFWVRAFKEIYNPTLAIEVLNKLKKEYSTASLCMVGPFVDDSYKKSLELFKTLGLEDSIELTNVLLKEEWHEKSKDYDIFINTTNFDNTPVSVMEAMALGLPIVSTNVGGLPFLVENKIDGLLVDKENVDEMTNAIKAILNNKYPNLAFNARQKVEGFSWGNNKEKWLEILK
ncbi:glycosyl transferase family 1 [Polaribacter sp. SA4-10]|uniref:glycosyltransferase family 4 protein n=1 Tax=Polaribacter sp. SA4-10 TaxID=754397 RepID=UPI000B3D0447|nr:glycosyltransferase family 4 protein [Polaribacter sp. SA4-10]ARV05515.1 glycosyl transferase family 1 [Polaribacter sp. SA4-10]